MISMSDIPCMSCRDDYYHHVHDDDRRVVVRCDKCFHELHLTHDQYGFYFSSEVEFGVMLEILNI